MDHEPLTLRGDYNIMAVLRDMRTGQTRRIPGRNLVTNDGDAYFAQKVGGSEPFTVAGIRLGLGTPTPGKTDTDVASFLTGGTKAVDAGYPKVSDDDADNSAYASADSNTWRFSFGTADGNGTAIREGAIVDNLTTPTKAVNHFVFAANFNKTTSDTLKVFSNVNCLGS